MELIIKQSPDIGENRITIECSHISPQLEKIIREIRSLDYAVNGRDGESWYRIPLEQIFYFDSVDGKTFLYASEKCYEVKESLSELEGRLQNLRFLRISKNTLIHLEKLQSTRVLPFSKMEVTMKNGEKLIVTRYYLESFKKAFGL